MEIREDFNGDSLAVFFGSSPDLSAPLLQLSLLFQSLFLAICVRCDAGAVTFSLS